MKRMAVTFTTVATFAAVVHSATADSSTAPSSVLAAHPTPQTHVVRMVQKGDAFAFAPEEVRARNGDRIRFVMVSGAPHNVAFDAEQVPAVAHATLSRALPDRMSALAGPLLTEEGAAYTMTLDGIPPGRYPFFCMPHVAMKMTGVLIVDS